MRRITMKNIITFFAIFGLAAQFSMEAGAWCITPWGCAEEAIKKLENGESPTPTQEALCRKGVAKQGVFSLRSFEGYACKYSKTWASLAVSICPMVDKDPSTVANSYLASKCHAYAVDTIGTDDPAKAKAVLVEELKKKTDKAKDILCSLIGTAIPGISLICGVAKN